MSEFTIQTKEYKYKDMEEYFKLNCDTLSITSVSEFLMLNDIHELTIRGTLKVHPYEIEMYDDYTFRVLIYITTQGTTYGGKDTTIMLDILKDNSVLYSTENYDEVYEKYIGKLTKNQRKKIVEYIVMDFLSSSIAVTSGTNEKTGKYEFYISGIQDGFVRSINNTFKSKKNRYEIYCNDIGILNKSTKNNPWKLEARDVIKGLGAYCL